MSTRKAKKEDALGIGLLLGQLNYPVEEAFITDQLIRLLNHEDHLILVYELENEIVGFLSAHFIPQIALSGDFGIISYFAVDSSFRSRGIGKELEETYVNLARERKCDRIQVHCNFKRTEAHKFYERYGYAESPKYFSKGLQ
ncbi:GNAT family N-acetyltransferase [Pedobacter gandavensis]|uniref:GNAT family N-acetyltransferase n=1 Tax=Pedobacter gandavensis TaxID=2679963 RepID=UPI00247AF60C|nr:GNAT family N-acetyltransferase [Pedobacter gandavensis]WGQ10948.1 GNAT family N-acetyltransferase [Pedobacter gandavensis]